jgi:hypothetical protein
MAVFFFFFFVDFIVYKEIFHRFAIPKQGIKSLKRSF